MKIKIKPLDLLFFRDAKPFIGGEENQAVSLVFPNLATIYGALRSSYFAEHKEALKLAQTDQDPTKSLVVNHVCYLNQNSILWPKPADLFVNKDMSKLQLKKAKRNNLYPAKMMKCVEMGGNINSLIAEQNLQHYYVCDERAEDIDFGVVTKEELLNYGMGQSEIDIKTLSHCISKEDKVGIARNDERHAVEEGMLYYLSQIRYHNLELVVDFDCLCLPESGFLKLGGEGKGVAYSNYEGELFDNEIYNQKVKYLKLYLTSPAIFENGWIPDFINKDSKFGVLNGKQVKLIAGCVANPLHVGGYDMKLRKEKPIKKVVPAGSIYLLETLEDYMLKDYMEYIELDSELSKEGYGRAIIMEGRCE